MVYMLRIIILFVLVELVISAKSDEKEGKNKATKEVKKRGRSTSSSSNEKKDSDSSGHSLELSLTESSSNEVITKRKKKSYKPKSSKERTGWRKWHRKCQQCPEDMRKKWRDPDIKWICAAYQRARRSFKSLCMMHYRNCQDGTMFTKIAEHRCKNDTTESGNYTHGDHFFYDYSVDLSMDSSKSSSKFSSSESVSSSEEFNSLDSARIASLEKNAINDLALRKKSSNKKLKLNKIK